MQEIKLAHHNDGKQKYQSHEISIFDKCDDYCDETGTFGIHDLAAIIGYGESEEQAREDFKNKFNSAFDQLKEFHRKLNSDDIENDAIGQIEVDYAGNEI